MTRLRVLAGLLSESAWLAVIVVTPVLFNPYGVIAVNPQKHPDVNYMAAMQYIAWVTSVQGQKVIREYRMGGQQLFTPDAVK